MVGLVTRSVAKQGRRGEVSGETSSVDGVGTRSSVVVDPVTGTLYRGFPRTPLSVVLHSRQGRVGTEAESGWGLESGERVMGRGRDEVRVGPLPF